MEGETVVKIALLGIGTVGMGVYKLIRRQEEKMVNKIGAKLEIKKILVQDMKKERLGIDPSLLTDRWEEIREDKEIDIIVEVIGGMEPARTYILESFWAGKNVVTANKDLLAEHGQELLEASHTAGKDLLFEASVGGGIPIIRPIKECLAGNHITSILGIVNGTTNYILTRMTKDGMEFNKALKLATELGFAEANPISDIEGYDAGRKIAILSSVAFHSRVAFSDVKTEGIANIKVVDIQYAKEMGCVIKLVAVANNTEEGIEVRVHPMLIPEEHPLASVNDSFNAIFLHGDAVDDAMFLGRGAGEMPTASAILGDIIDCARNLKYSCNGRIGCTCYKNTKIKDGSSCISRYFLRMQVEDRPGVLANVASVLGRNKVSIAQVIQKSRNHGVAEIVAITDPVVEGDFLQAMDEFSQMPIIKEISTTLRVYNK